MYELEVLTSKRECQHLALRRFEIYLRKTFDAFRGRRDSRGLVTYKKDRGFFARALAGVRDAKRDC